MWQYNYTNELYHYGVPGMKWGVRRAQKKAYRAEIKRVKQSYKEDINKAIDENSKKIDKLNKKINSTDSIEQLNKLYEEASPVAEKQRRMIYAKKGRSVVNDALKGSLLGVAVHSLIYSKTYNAGERTIKNYLINSTIGGLGGAVSAVIMNKRAVSDNQRTVEEKYGIKSVKTRKKEIKEKYRNQR